MTSCLVRQFAGVTWAMTRRVCSERNLDELDNQLLDERKTKTQQPANALARPRAASDMRARHWREDSHAAPPLTSGVVMALQSQVCENIATLISFDSKRREKTQKPIISRCLLKASNSIYKSTIMVIKPLSPRWLRPVSFQSKVNTGLRSIFLPSLFLTSVFP